MKKLSEQLGLHFTAIASVVTLGLWIAPTIARDFFRSEKPHQIGDKTEAAFKAIFAEGNYPEGQRLLELAKEQEPNEPLVYSLLGGFAYLNQDSEGVKIYAKKTLEAADKLAEKDPLRGKIYTSIGHFLVSAESLKKEGSLGVIPKIQLVLDNIDEAAKISPEDPELNLIKGYMDLVLALNLPFSDASAAIERLDKYAAPRYIAERAIALGYRDLKQYSKALNYVDRAIKATPNNPELYYLKAQIQVRLAKQKKNSDLLTEASSNFDKALQKSTQLPKVLVGDIAYEKCQTQAKLSNTQPNCRSLKAEIKKQPGLWGPAKLPIES
jgi:tetratricopeptide (TPR) repeat protein